MKKTARRICKRFVLCADAGAIIAACFTEMKIEAILNIKAMETLLSQRC